MKKRQAIIIGGGPAGSATALYLLQAGIQPLIVERQTFPRYHIGESLSGECRNSLQRLGLEPAILARSYPDKHGVNVFNPNGVPFWVEVKRRCPETQALIPNATWSVARSSFDKILLDAARERGAEYIPCEAVAPVRKGNRVTGLQIRPSSGLLEELSCDVLVDCSGQGTFLANRGVTGPKVKGSYANQVAIYSQLHGVTRDAGTTAATAPGNTLIFYKQKHHWAWMIPISDSETSVGVVVPASYLKARQLDKPEFLRTELLSLNPNLSHRITNTNFLEEVRSSTSYCYSVSNYSGPGFLCVGDSHEFTDPIFSFGVFLSIREAEFAVEAIQSYLGRESTAAGNPFAFYERVNAEGQDAVRDLIDCFWEYPLAFTRMADGARRDDITDLFAGRLYGQIGQNNQARLAMRKLMTARRAQLAAPNLQPNSRSLEETASALA
jgi:FADH2-dependent halogenase